MENKYFISYQFMRGTENGIGSLVFTRSSLIETWEDLEAICKYVCDKHKFDHCYLVNIIKLPI